MAVGQFLPSPTNARVGQVLVLHTNKVEYQTRDPIAAHFANLVLLNKDDRVEDFVGVKTVNGYPINEGATIQFTLPEITILKAGTYRLRLDVYMIVGTGSTHLIAITSALFEVSA